MTVKWIEPTSAGDTTPIERSLNDAEAINLARLTFKQERPDEEDPRNDAQCLDDFLVVYWAVHEPE